MIVSKVEINPIIARQILEIAKRKGVTVEVYLKEISESNNDDFPKVKKTNEGVDLSLSQKWLNENQHNYLGKWVVLDGDKLIGASNNPKELVEVARNAGVKIPFVHFIDDDQRPFVGGWL
jgi:Family of unknown function (DUF5678)